MTAETFLNDRITLHCGDSRDVIKTIADNSIDSIVCDPPYALVSIVKRFGKADSAAVKVPEDGSGAYARASAGFMGKAWDTGETAFAVEFWAECLRVLKPGGHVVAFSGTRTYHRMACAIEDAGFEVRDMLSWLYGSGFPKSHDVSKGIDKAAGVEREVVGYDASKARPNKEGFAKVASGSGGGAGNAGHKDNGATITAPSTDSAIEWQGWGTALKPACEPICFGRKPLTGTVAANVLEWGCGAINIDGTRIYANGKGGSGGSISASGTGCSIHGVRGLQVSDAPLAVSGGSPQMADDMRQQMPLRANEGLEQSELDRGRLDGQEVGLSDIGDGPIERSRQTTFTDANATGIPRASVGCGEKIREGASDGGAHSPRKRREGRQQTGQSNSDGLVGAFEGAPAHGAQSVGAVGREQAAPRCTCNIGLGRWPANVITDGSEEVIAAFPVTGNNGAHARHNASGGQLRDEGNYRGPQLTGGHDDEGSAARFFYTSKADSDDRLGSKHPTVKPVDLMQWLCRLVTPKRVLFCPKCDTLRNGKNSQTSDSQAGHDTPMRVVSDGLQTEGQPAHGQILQSAMCGCSEGASAEAVRLVRDDVPAEEGRGASLLQPIVRGEMDGEEPQDIKGLCDEQGGVSAPVDAGSSPIAQSEGLHLRASLGDAAEDRQAADQSGSRASHKRNQKRQQARKSGTDAEGGSRQDQSAEAERSVLPSLSGQDRHQPTCKDCGHFLEWGPGIVLDPFSGTGTTGEAAFREGFNAILIEREAEYQTDIRRRMALCMSGPDERKRESIKAKVGDLPFEAGSLFAGLGAAE